MWPILTRFEQARFIGKILEEYWCVHTVRENDPGAIVGSTVCCHESWDRICIALCVEARK